MPKIILAASFWTILLGCTSTSQKDSFREKNFAPPLPSFIAKWQGQSTKDLEQLVVGPQEVNIYWWKKYTLALVYQKTNNPLACNEFTTLSLDENFPLRDLALLRAHESCADVSTLTKLPQDVPPWYSDLYIDIRLAESKLTPEKNDDADALLLKGRSEVNRKNKEQFYLAALKAAEQAQAADKIVEITEILYKSSPRLEPHPNPDQYKAVANDFRINRNFSEAIEFYKKILGNKKATDAEYYEALKDIRQTYKIAQKKKEYIQASEELQKWTGKKFKAQRKPTAQIARQYNYTTTLLARTLWTEDQTNKAIQILLTGEKELKPHHSLDEVYMILGRIHEERKNFDKAIEYFELSYAQKPVASGLRDRVAWFKAWNYYKLENWNKAEESLQQMIDSSKDNSDKFRARFWLARTLKKLNRAPEATKLQEDLIAEDTLGFYGMLAHRELGREFKKLESDHDELTKLSLLGVSQIPKANRIVGEWLIAVNEKTAAEKLLVIESDSLRNKKVSDEKTWLTMSSAYARAGLYLPLFSAIGSLPVEVKDKLVNNHPELLFPTPYEDIIRGAATKSRVPAEMIYSIIRQESAFNPEARSPVDAFGLMQLLPSIAKKIAQKNNLKYSTAQDLFIPEINVPLGAFELKTLTQKYKNSFILSVSGYNANGNAIRGWLSTRSRPDTVEFIEEVPYEETRSYIKLTMRNYIFYKRLLGSESSFIFPETLLKL